MSDAPAILGIETSCDETAVAVVRGSSITAMMWQAARGRAGSSTSLAAEPRMLILDEGLSSLDLSLQAQIVNLLVTLQEQ